ncbi:AMP-binding protein, partial [Gordonia sp. ABSL1-1]|uniref:AMP-binding protein n=1 Tax=Gordonia sp. ABSL1-1 TaxID=3053923 RepID=UPI002572ACFE
MALIFGARRVSYAEFGIRVNELARRLRAAGVGPDVAVLVAIPRSVELLVAVHAVVMAGGHYVPVDLDTPIDRVRYMAEVVGAGHAVVDAHDTAAEVFDGLDRPLTVLQVDAETPVESLTVAADDDSAPVVVRPDDAAYTLFTSGSTGRPKGVTVSHRAIVNRLEWMREWYSVKESDVFLQKTPVTFDVSVWELFLPLTVGASLVVAEPDRHGDPGYLAEVMVGERVSVVHFVPSMLAAFVDVLGDRVGGLSGLRLMFTSGEALTASVAQSVLGWLPELGLHNLYGPTEAAVDVTAHRVCVGETSVPIGVPV